MVKVGSRVKFVSDTGAGIVRSIKGNLAYVEVDGFEIPALLSDVVEVAIQDEAAAMVRIGPDEPKVKNIRHTAQGPNTVAARTIMGQYGKVTIAEDWEDDEQIDIGRIKQNYQKQTIAQVAAHNTELSKIVEKAPFEVTDFNLKLVFVPVKSSGKAPQESDLEMYIVNDSSYEVYFNIARWMSGYVTTIKGGLLEGDTKQSIYLFSRASLAQITTLHISILPFKSTSFVPHRVENFDIELHPLKFVRTGSYAVNDFFDEPSIVFTLASSELTTEPLVEIQDQMLENSVNAKSIKANKPSIPKAKSDLKPKGEVVDNEVIDLHAEAFLDNFETLNNTEILTAQLSRFTIALDGAIKSGNHGKIVFIHGIGKGKLKYDMKKILDHTYSKYRYQDASFAEYGYGAIMVFI